MTLTTRLLAVVSLFCAAPVLAHETWLIPSQFAAKVGEEIWFDLTSGMAFPRLEGAIQAQRVANASCRLGKERFEVTDLRAELSSLVLRRSFPKEGVATIWLDLKPKEIELSDDQVAEYLDEIGASAEIRRLWSEQRGRVAFKETYTKHAKTFVGVGDIGGDTSWKVPVGAALELVPRTNPCAVVAGTDFVVELRSKEGAVAGASIGLIVDGAKDRVFRKTDSEGLASFPVTRPGRAMTFVVLLNRQKDGTSWVSDFATLTFQVHGG